MQVAKHFHHAGKDEVHGAQAQDGEDVRGVNDEGVAGDGEIAGMESTAKSRSVVSTTSSTTNSGVA